MAWPATAFFARAAYAAVIVAIWLASANASAAGLRVIVTIKPIHSLAASIMEGVAQPQLLLDGAASPHSYALKPSGARAIAQSDLVIFVSRNLETFLAKAIETLPAQHRAIELEQTPGLRLLPVRRAGHLGVAAEGEQRDPHGHSQGVDVHFWLDPSNAVAISRSLAQRFAALDPEHKALYEANEARLEARLLSLDAELKLTLAGLSGKPFIVFHDVTQYFETGYGLSGLGAITLSPERAPGAKRLSAVRARIIDEKAVCVFSEPEFPPKLVQTLIADTSAKQGVVDEVGAAIPAGPELYFTLMRMDAANLAACLNS